MEIKFKAYHIKNKKMYEVFSFCDEFVKIIVGIGSVIKLPRTEFKPLMQFTNKQDKNGKDIYKGDIVEIKLENYTGFKTTFLRFLIVFHQDGFQGCNLIKKYKVNYLNQEVLHNPKRFNYKEWDRMEVIGNIHENPELLKQ